MRGSSFVASWRSLTLVAAVLLGGCGSATVSKAPSVNRASVRVGQEVRTLTLQNGLVVIVSEDHRTPQVAINVLYHVGGKDDPVGRSGLAHLYEHLMFDGTQYAERFDRYMSAGGAAAWNATTTRDHTQYWETIPRAMLEQTLWLEADRMAARLDVSPSFTRERAVVRNERRERYENAPYGTAPEVIGTFLFPDGHPYRRPVIGTMAEIDSITPADVALFRRRYYVPDNATIVVVGDVATDAVLSLVKKYFGDLPARGGARPALEAPIPVTLDDDVLVTMEADVDVPRLYSVFPAPPYGGADRVALKDATGYVWNVLDDRMVRVDKVARRVDAYYEADRLAGSFWIEIDLERDVTFKTARASMDAALSRLSARYTRFTASSTDLSAKTSQLILDLEDDGPGETRGRRSRSPRRPSLSHSGPVTFSKSELEEAQRSLASTLAKCEKVLPKLKEGSSQHTLLVRRIRALAIASELVRRELESA